MDNLPSLPAFASYKARALAGLTDAERHDLLAAAGALGLADDNDPFWIYQASVTQLGTLLAQTRADAAAALADARAVAKQLKPTQEIADEIIKRTVAAGWDKLAADASAEIGRRLAAEARRRMDEGAHRASLRAEIGGMVTVTIGIVLAFVLGVALGRGGWFPATVYTAVTTTTVGELLAAQAVVIGAVVLWAHATRRP